MKRLRRRREEGSFARAGQIGWLPGFGLPAAGFRRLPSVNLPRSLGRIGNLELVLAANVAEVKQAQRLRYKVFYEEMSAVPGPASALVRRDMDEFDAICDHLLVLDHDVPAGAFKRATPKVVGTYRLLRQDVAEVNWGFYSAAEYDVAGLIARKPDLNFLELGRSCVLKPYRTKRIVELLWQGIWAYVRAHDIDAMIGCASLEGVDPERLALPLSYLAQAHGASEGWRTEALAQRRVEMNRLAPEAVDVKAALKQLPPLIKGYLRVGAMVGDGAVIDRQFGTTDVFIVMPVDAIGTRYIDYYQR
ncbi:hypothetical protein GCM10007276_28990 [Agaricicola taiwanensis]|uniref:L-ornithine N(alpha)-acyltransferase n=1 Tax=Agaricicola taiwanensis TaxID=591372 RepID=A0A8J2YK38_9RHOB|nr:GNAT family N-acyltransferase [Agaricicola taiwanensis]GGE50094.1 hypothetical protein GCM10007276_28990 [Agaricicola taiwanensis]